MDALILYIYIWTDEMSVKIEMERTSRDWVMEKSWMRNITLIVLITKGEILPPG